MLSIAAQPIFEVLQTHLSRSKLGREWHRAINEHHRSIATAIDDRLPRLVFADWLDEQGDPRAEWLRVDCELAELGPGDGRRPALEARKRALWDAHRDGLIGW